MSHLFKRGAAALLGAAMALCMSAWAFAEDAGQEEAPAYTLKVEDKTLYLVRGGESVAEYALEEAAICLMTNRETGNQIVSFVDETGEERWVSLGEQETITVDGSLSYLEIGAKLRKEVAVAVTQTAKIEQVRVAAPAPVEIAGDITRLSVMAGAEVDLLSKARVETVVVRNKDARVKAKEGARVDEARSLSALPVKSLELNTKAKVTIEADETEDTDDRDWYDRYWYGRYDWWWYHDTIDNPDMLQPGRGN